MVIVENQQFSRLLAGQIYLAVGVLAWHKNL